MLFINDAPEFKTFPEHDFYMHTVPDDAWTPLESMIRKVATSGEKLKAIMTAYI